MLSVERSFARASQGAAELARIPQLAPLYDRSHMRIHQGDLVMIVGRSGSQKSGLALFLAAMLGKPALYFSGDMTPWEASTRIIAMNYRHTVGEIEKNVDEYGAEYYDNITVGDSISFVFESPITWRGASEEIDAYLELWGEYPSVIVIDNLMDVEGCESDYQAQQTAMQWITALSRETRATTIVTHHATDKTVSDTDTPPSRKEIKNGLSEKPQLILGVSFYGGEENTSNVLTIPQELRVAVLKQRSGKSFPDGSRYERLRAFPEYTFFGPLAERYPWNM